MKNSKKRKVSKKTKKSLRKHVDTKDVDLYLDNVRLDERLGVPFGLRENEELFSVDTASVKPINLNRNCNLTKKQKRALLMNSSPKCYAILKPHTAVPDPITKRNSVKTSQERETLVSKPIEVKRSKKKMRLNMQVIGSRLTSEKRMASKCDIGGSKVNVWKNIPIIDSESKNEWLTNDTIRHTLSNTGRRHKRVPKSVQNKPSVLPAISVPHPGTSYNPLFTDHQKLLSLVVSDEIKFMKEEDHLNRVTSKMFKKELSHNQIESDNIEVMTEGLPNSKENLTLLENEYKYDPSVILMNPPVVNAKKTLAQRRKKKEERQLEFQRLKDKLEKKKVSDIYHIKQLEKRIHKEDKEKEILKVKQIQLQARKILQPKILSRHKFEPLEQEFLLGNDLSANLRNTQPAGNLLKDRYKSLQQRNIIAPNILILRKCKTKIKKFVKLDHKIDVPKTVKSSTLIT